jgi:DNA polymerase III subunit alpha
MTDVSIISPHDLTGQDQPPAFVHLHVHTEYSLIDGTIRTKQLIKKAKQWGHSAVAITDSGNLFGAVEFYNYAKAEGLKAIIGCEIYFEGHPLTLQIAAARNKAYPEAGAFHLVLLCKNNAGYKNLCKIVSAGYTEGLKDVPVVTVANLRSWPNDMIALSGDGLSEICFLVGEFRRLQPDGALNFASTNPHEQDVIEAIKEHINAIHSYVGIGNYYVELIDNRLSSQHAMMRDLNDLARHFSLPTVATADAHYADPSFALAQSVFVAIKSSLTFKELRGRNRQARFHLLDNQEFYETYHQYPEAIANTLVIADQCNVSFKFGSYYLPKFPLPEGVDEAKHLANISEEMLEDRLKYLAKIYGPTFTEERQNEYRARLKYEISVIQSMKFPGYFLIVQDFINWAKNQGIPVGPGRGSGAGSLVAYALRITDLDPLRFNLLFERFLNPERISMPDFDVDFCQFRRGEVIDYVNQKYGRNNVAQIATFGKMKAKLAVRDVARVMEISYGRADKIAKLIPAKVLNDKNEEVEATIPLAMKAEPRLVEEAEKDSAIKEILDITAQLEGLNRQTGIHPAGIVMSDGPMTDYVPVFTTEDGGLVTQFEMKNAEKVGLVKFDFLGLKTLTTLDFAVKLVKATVDPTFDLSAIELEDPEVYRDISEANTTAVFQLEGDGMKKLVAKLKPSCFEDIIALVALFRPGPLGSGMVDDFVERKHGRQVIVYPLPELEDILKETYGVILYQEQVQKTAVILANYTPGEADMLRRAMGKKIKSEMDQQKDRFLKGAAQNNLDVEKSEQIFDLMAKFAEYGFNKSHSAAYGLIAYQTAYLKTKFPELFMAAAMTCDIDKTDKVISYAVDCIRMKMAVLPPNINESLLEFSSPKKSTIRWGLAAIKGIGSGSVEALVVDRKKNGPFLNLYDMARRVNLHGQVGKKTMELLIKTGAMDQFCMTREHMLSIIGSVVKYSENHFLAQKNGQKSLFDFGDEQSTQNLSSSQDAHPDWLATSDRRPPITLEALEEERKLTGLYLTGHPMDFYKADTKRFSKTTLASAHKFASITGRDKIQLVAIFQGANIGLGKKDQRPRAFVSLDDRSGTVEGMMFEKDIPPAFPVVGTPVWVQASIKKLPDGSLLRMKIDRIMTIEEVRQHSVKSFTVNMDMRQGADSEQQSIAKLSNLASLALKNRGPTKLRLELEFKDYKVMLDAGEDVELTNSVIRLVQTLGMTGRYE